MVIVALAATSIANTKLQQEYQHLGCIVDNTAAVVLKGKKCLKASHGGQSLKILSKGCQQHQIITVSRFRLYSKIRLSPY